MESIPPVPSPSTTSQASPFAAQSMRSRSSDNPNPAPFPHSASWTTHHAAQRLAQAGPSTYRQPHTVSVPQQSASSPEPTKSQPRPHKKRKVEQAALAGAGAYPRSAVAGPSAPVPTPQPLVPTTAIPAGYIMHAAAQPSAPAFGQQSAPAPVKRPRGRPRKDAQLPLSLSTSAYEADPSLVGPSQLPSAAPGTPPADTDQPVKRPRGRPRKSSLRAPVPSQPPPSSSSSSLLPTSAASGSQIPSTAHIPPPAAPGSSYRLAPPTTLKEYVNRLNAHIASTSSHSAGDADAYLPTGEWSADDKASFYPILARHSTLRPDLVARDTDKSEEQVQQHLGSVQAQLPPFADHGRSGRGEWMRGMAPAARQIGEGDIREEEAVAEELLAWEAKTSSRKKGKAKQDAVSWGAQLNGAKLSTLSALVHATIPSDPLAGNKAAKLLRDEQSLAALLAVPTDQRSQTQVKEIRRLKDKKTMRMKYRHAKLLAEGMTAEEITAQGGPDAIYLARSGPADAGAAAAGSEVADPLKGNKYAKIMRDEARLNALHEIKAPNKEDIAEIRRLTNKKRARQRIRKRKLMEEGMTEEELADIDVDELFAQRAGIPWGEEQEEEFIPELVEWVSARGLDLWNFDKMGRALGDVQISFDILDHLKTYLLAFLVPLILKVINIAEREGGEPNADHVRLLLELASSSPAIPDEVEGEVWEIQTTTTDHEEEELDDLLEDVDEAYDRTRDELGGDWDDPFHVEKIKQGGGEEARAKRKEYLQLLRRYSGRKARRAAKRERGVASRGRGSVEEDSESLVGMTDEESLMGTTDEESSAGEAKVQEDLGEGGSDEDSFGEEEGQFSGSDEDDPVVTNEDA